MNRDCSTCRRFGLFVLVLGCLFFAGTSIATAQSSSASGRLEGTVVDPSGSSVPSGPCPVGNGAPGKSFTQQADDRGYFLFLYLVPGHYQVSIEKTGFTHLV